MQGQAARPEELRPRPPVTAYVTREHPETGADELLVFDFPGEPQLSSVIPGGGIEKGETVEETAIREVLEETGIEAELVRIVGIAEHARCRALHRAEPAIDERRARGLVAGACAQYQRCIGIEARGVGHWSRR